MRCEQKEADRFQSNFLLTTMRPQRKDQRPKGAGGEPARRLRRRTHARPRIGGADIHAFFHSFHPDEPKQFALFRSGYVPLVALAEQPA